MGASASRTKSPRLVRVQPQEPVLSLVFAVKAKLRFAQKKRVRPAKKCKRSILRRTLREILSVPTSRALFFEFLESSEYCSELVNFWVAVDDYEEEATSENALKIYNAYLSPGAVNFVNASAVNTKDIQRRIDDCPPDLFQNVRDEIFGYLAERKLENFPLWISTTLEAPHEPPHRTQHRRRSSPTVIEPFKQRRTSSFGDIANDEDPLAIETSLKIDAATGRRKIKEAQKVQNLGPNNGFLDMSSLEDDRQRSSRHIAEDGFYSGDSDDSSSSSDHEEKAQPLVPKRSSLFAHRRFSRESSTIATHFVDKQRRFSLKASLPPTLLSKLRRSSHSTQHKEKITFDPANLFANLSRRASLLPPPDAPAASPPEEEQKNLAS